MVRPFSTVAAVKGNRCLPPLSSTRHYATKTCLWRYRTCDWSKFWRWTQTRAHKKVFSTKNVGQAKFSRNWKMKINWSTVHTSGEIHKCMHTLHTNRYTLKHTNVGIQRLMFVHTIRDTYKRMHIQNEETKPWHPNLSNLDKRCSLTTNYTVLDRNK